MTALPWDQALLSPPRHKDKRRGIRKQELHMKTKVEADRRENFEVRHFFSSYQLRDNLRSPNIGSLTRAAAGWVVGTSVRSPSQEGNGDGHW